MRPVIPFLAECILLDTIEHVSYSLAGRNRVRQGAWTTAGIGAHLIALFIWLRLLVFLPLSQALPLRGASYITIALAGRFLFSERVNAASWIGIAVIVAGVALICRQP